jgi:hypothetical protein
MVRVLVSLKHALDKVRPIHPSLPVTLPELTGPNKRPGSRRKRSKPAYKYIRCSASSGDTFESRRSWVEGRRCECGGSRSDDLENAEEDDTCPSWELTDEVVALVSIAPEALASADDDGEALASSDSNHEEAVSE